jgi:hypothetical protein
MAGLRLIDAPPETFRFPEWRDDIYYAADSVVRYASYMAINDSDSEATRTNIYVAIKNVAVGSGEPTLRPYLWASITNNTAASDSDAGLGTLLIRILDNDSDILALQGLVPDSWDYGIVF